MVALKELYPERVHLLLGNHDCVTRGSGTAGVKGMALQGAVFLSHVQGYLTQRGFTPAQIKGTLEAYQGFFDSAPAAFVSRGGRYAIFAAHCPVIIGGASLDDIAAAKKNGLLDQLTWNSFAHQDPRPGKRYSEGDVRLMSEKRALTAGPRDTFVVGGHVKGSRFYYLPFPGQLSFSILHSKTDDFGAVSVVGGHARKIPLSTTCPRV